MSSGIPDLTRADTGAWLWDHLRATFPAAIAAMLMPDHPHLVVPSTDADADRRRLARLLGHFGRRFGVRGRASEVADPEPIRPGPVLARQVRYVALNPCRKRLVGCPLAWRWSTHRDVVGAAADPWVEPTRLARAIGFPPHGFAERHHAYVSGDPSASVVGTPFPREAEPSDLPAAPLRVIAEACAAATRSPLGAIRELGQTRALFVSLAREQGWTCTEQLARVCDCSRHTIRRLSQQHDPSGLSAARMCLADARLR